MTDRVLPSLEFKKGLKVTEPVSHLKIIATPTT